MLIVDDDNDIVEAICLALEREGYEIRAAATMEDAVEIARTLQPFLMLVDYRLPGVDAVSLVRSLRRVVASANIVLCTAAEAPEVLAQSVGADRVLAKPFTLDELLMLARQACGTWEARQ